MNPEDVSNRKSFIQFVNALRNDFEANNQAWENVMLRDFLEALEVYSGEIEGYYNNVLQHKMLMWLRGGYLPIY